MDSDGNAFDHIHAVQWRICETSPILSHQIKQGSPINFGSEVLSNKHKADFREAGDTKLCPIRNWVHAEVVEEEEDDEGAKMLWVRVLKRRMVTEMGSKTTRRTIDIQRV